MDYWLSRQIPVVHVFDFGICPKAEPCTALEVELSGQRWAEAAALAAAALEE